MTKPGTKRAPQSVALPVKFGVHALVGRDSVEPRQIRLRFARSV